MTRAPASPHVRRSVVAVLTVVALAGLLGACSESSSFDVSDASSGAADLTFVIPAGAGQAIDRGEPLDILPGRLDVHVGDVIEIVNHDDRGHLVGPFFVGAGETVRQRFASQGEFQGECSVHPSGQIVVVVS